MTRKNLTVADYLNSQLNIATKTQTEIAKELGYDKPNIITMFKQGRTKLPLNKVAPLAHSLGVDPLHMLRVVMQDYSPETWEVLESVIGTNLVSNEEMEVVKLMRQVAGEHVVKPQGVEEVSEFKELIKKWKKRATAPVIRHH